MFGDLQVQSHEAASSFRSSLFSKRKQSIRGRDTGQTIYACAIGLSTSDLATCRGGALNQLLHVYVRTHVSYMYTKHMIGSVLV